MKTNRLAWVNQGFFFSLLTIGLYTFITGKDSITPYHVLWVMSSFMFFFFRWVSHTLCDFMDAIVRAEFERAKVEVLLEEVLDRLDNK